MAATSVVIMFKENFIDNSCSTKAQKLNKSELHRNEKATAASDSSDCTNQIGYKPSLNQVATSSSVVSPTSYYGEVDNTVAVNQQQKSTGSDRPDNKSTTMSPYATRTNIMNWLKDTRDAGTPIVGQSLIG